MAAARDGQRRESDTFRTKQEAAQWALARAGAKLPDKSFGDALSRYGREVSPSHKGSRWELLRLASLEREPIASKRLSRMAAPDFMEWRDARLREVSTGTVAREMTLIRSVLRMAWKEWHCCGRTRSRT